MKRIRKAARITGVIVAAILTALVVTVLCTPEEECIEFAEMVDSLSGQKELERQMIGTASLKRSSLGSRCPVRA